MLSQSTALKLASVRAANEGNFVASVLMARKAIELDPHDPAVRTNLGITFWMMEKYSEAEAEFQAALDMGSHPDQWRAYMGLAKVLFAVGRRRFAIEMLQRAVATIPSEEEQHEQNIHVDLGYALLAEGDFGGFEFLVHRWSGPANHIWNMDIPQMLAGERILGSRVLVHHHQGLGDTIQFCRFLPWLREIGAHVIAVVPRQLVRLLEASHLADEVVDLHGAIPPADVHLPIGLLPWHMGLELNDLPWIEDSYLLSDQAPLPLPQSDSFKIGIAWSANSRHETGRKRSLRLEDLLPLVEIPNVKLYALQPNAAIDIAEAGAGLLVEDLGWALRDFADTAAYMKQMDLVVSADSAPLHLAGAIGVPCVGLLSYAFADWRWLGHDRVDTPWYPSMQIIRQRAPGDWAGVVERLAIELRTNPSSIPAAAD